MRVELSWYELVGAVDVARLRLASASMAKLNPATTYERSFLERLADDVLGACGERAFCKARGLYWDGSVNTFHGTPDVGQWEVRTTAREDGSLIVRDNDDPRRWYVLVTGTPPVFVVRGFIHGSRARSERFARNPRQHRPAYFVPQTALTPFTVERAS